MNFAIRYLTEYRYEAPVLDNLNALRVRPATTATQRCDEFSLRLEPEARVSRHADYFGTEVLEFGIAKPHEHLTIDVRARVVTSEPDEPPETSWAALDTASYREAAGEFLLVEEQLPLNGAVGELVEAARRFSPAASVRAVGELVHERFEYRPGVTYVGSTVDDLLAGGAGVCQDFAHLGLILLRRMGIAARYVSGYLWAAPHDAVEGDSLEVQTHAWIEALLPTDREPVWVGSDPTNDRFAGETHVKIGHGRSYADVPPIKGVYQGRAGSLLESRVTMTRLDPAASARP